MLRPYVTDIPARRDLSFRTNSDTTFGAVWVKVDGTPVEVASAVCSLEFDLQPSLFDPDTGEPLPDPDPVRHVVDATDPADPGGFIDVDGYPDGQVVVTVPHGVWATVAERSGNWDIVATNIDAVTRCLIRGIFTVEEGVT
jgi:hypothetical protein